MWLQASFTMPDEAASRLFSSRRTPQSVRKWLASAATRYEIPLDSRVFGYAQGGGTPSNPRHIGIGVLGRGMSLHAVGEDNIRLVQPHLPAIQAALIRDGGAFVHANLLSGQCQFEFTRVPLQYFLRGVYVSHADKDDAVAKVWDSLQGEDQQRLSSEELKKAVANVIDRSLSRQVRMLMLKGELVSGSGMAPDALALPQGGCERSEDYLDAIREVLVANGVSAEPRAMLSVEVQSIRRCTWVAASSSTRVSRLLLSDVAFTAKAHMGGLWLAGMALSFGDGVVAVQPRGNLSIKRDMLRKGVNAEVEA